MSELLVSIVQEDCTSCGLCPTIDPDIFFMHDDSLAYVKTEGSTDPTHPEFATLAGQVVVSLAHIDLVIEAAEECPGECIMILDERVE